MLARRKKPRHKEVPQTSFPRHRKYVRGFVCIVPGCHTETSDRTIECCHVRKGLPAGTPSWARGGASMKPHDAFCFSGCQGHHAEQHRIGEASFERKYGVALLKEALALARQSTVSEVREFARNLQGE